MNWRATALALMTTSAAWADGPKWAYARLVDAPLAPVERVAPVKILKVSADAGPAADGEVKHAVAMAPVDAKGSQVVKTSLERPAGKALEKPAVLKADAAVEPLSKTSAQAWRVFVGGEVVRPGAFNAQRPFTALQAVIAAGGLKEGGAAHEILVLRYRDKDAPPTAKRVDLSASLAGRGANDVWLETHDVVVVPKAGSSATTEELIRGLPIPVATAAKNKLMEVHRVKAEPSDLSKTELSKAETSKSDGSKAENLILPAR